MSREASQPGGEPDKVGRMPNTYIVSYRCCVFLGGEEREASWRSDNLNAGARVGLLVTEQSGDLIVFVDGEQVVLVHGAVPNATD